MTMCISTWHRYSIKGCCWSQSERFHKGNMYETKAQDLRFDVDRELRTKKEKDKSLTAEKRGCVVWKKRQRSTRSQRTSVQLRWSRRSKGIVLSSCHLHGAAHAVRHTYCWGFCGTAAAEARLLAASLAFSDASFTVSLSSRWGVSPVRVQRNRRDRMRTLCFLKSFSEMEYTTLLALNCWSDSFLLFRHTWLLLKCSLWLC